jgi:hypothetical protein
MKENQIAQVHTETFRAARVSRSTAALVAATVMSLALPVSAEPGREGSGTAPTTHAEPSGSASASATTGIPDVARRLWHDLLCLCGECEHKTLEACECNYAADRRQEILDAVRRLGFGTPKQDQATYAAVSHDYLEHHRADAEHAKGRHNHSSEWIDTTLTLGSAIAGMAVLVVMAELLRRRRAAKAEQRSLPRALHKRRRHRSAR